MLHRVLSKEERAFCYRLSEEWLVKAANAKTPSAEKWAMARATEWEHRAVCKLAVEHDTWLGIRSLMKVHK